MGWPRTNEGCRLYQERKDKSFLMVIVENGRNARGQWDSIGNAFAGSQPSLCSTVASDEYLQNACRRVQWDDLPEEWQRAFRHWMQDWDQSPDKIRGFWKVEHVHN